VFDRLLDWLIAVAAGVSLAAVTFRFVIVHDNGNLVLALVAGAVAGVLLSAVTEGALRWVSGLVGGRRSPAPVRPDRSGYVFISYKHGEDDTYILTLAAFLEQAGVPVWFDRDLITGDRFARVIRGRIDQCSALIVVMTPAADDSVWVKREINRAQSRHKPILPLLLRGEPFFDLSELLYESVAGQAMPRPPFVARLRQACARRSLTPTLR
jgi:hypothetical protein